MIPLVSGSRIRSENACPVRPDGEYVLYWMIAARRSSWNFALDRAAERCRELGRPLLVFEALRIDSKWATPRVHSFVADGMRDNARDFERNGVNYIPYVEPEPGAAKGLLEALASRACVVVTDNFPCHFLPSMVRAAAGKVTVLLESVDSNGLLPLSLSPRDFPTAYAFRRYLQRALPNHIEDAPLATPLENLPRGAIHFPPSLLAKWGLPSGTAATAATAIKFDALPLDAEVSPTSEHGGRTQALEVLTRFIERRLPLYAEGRSHPDEDVASGLSPFLHFGHISAHEIFRALARREKWNPGQFGDTRNGTRDGFWGMSAAAESFLDEFVTWRELGYTFNMHRPDYDLFDSLPEWAKATLARHAGDPRLPQYDRDQLESAATHDPLWNAAQKQLREEGRIQNYLRMLWGKKILEWTRSPQEALEVMIELNNRWALDGRNPNSYSGIFWVLGRYDRPWAPERPIFGVIRYMSSESAKKKLRLKKYLERWGEEAPPDLFAENARGCSPKVTRSE